MVGIEKCVDSRHGRYELKIYWEDGVTVECRYFLSIEDAKYYAERNGICDFMIVKN